jgi:adenylate cyclase
VELRNEDFIVTVTILVVDDNEANRVYLRELLETQSYIVLEAVSAKEALKVLESSRPSLILLDIMMPEMSGLELSKILKADSQTRAIPIIFLTALGDSADIVRGFDAGAVDYIAKPFNIREILARIQTQLQLEQQRSSLQESLTQLVRLQRMMNQYITKAARESIEDAVFGDDSQLVQPSRKTLTVMFTDIANFTTFSEALDPETLINSLTIYMSILTQIVHLRGGEVDKFLGDGMMAYFENAQEAFLAAIEIQIALKSFNQEQEDSGQSRFDTRIGMATGSVVQAHFGFDGRRELTIMGDRVNTAARLQGHAPLGGILVDAASYENAGNPSYSFSKTYTLKGKQQNEISYAFEADILLSLLLDN